MTLIELQNIRFSWRQDTHATINTPELKINAGEHVFIKGASGSGKSTLLNIIGGVIVPQQGKVQVMGHNFCSLSGIKRDKIRADNIGFIFQQFNLIPYLTILENVILPCRFSTERLQRSIERSGSVIDEAMYLLNHLYSRSKFDYSRQTNELSVGQRQRVAAARALIGQPALVIADEPTSSLDFDARQDFMDLLFNEVRSSGSTLLYVSHDPAHRQLFSREIDMLSINPASASQA